jgi:hypothetical protein
MWRRTQLLEGLVKDSMSLSNATRRELQDGIRTIAVQMGRRGLFQSDRDRQEGKGYSGFIRYTLKVRDTVVLLYTHDYRKIMLTVNIKDKYTVKQQTLLYVFMSEKFLSQCFMQKSPELHMVNLARMH